MRDMCRWLRYALFTQQEQEDLDFAEKTATRAHQARVDLAGETLPPWAHARAATAVHRLPQLRDDQG